MKKSMLVVFACIAMLAGCASTKAPTVTGIPESYDWWNLGGGALDRRAISLAGVDGISAVGKSRLSGLSGEQAAIMDGNVRLARRLQVGVIDMGKKQRGAELGKDEEERLRSESEQFTKGVLSGSQDLIRHYDEKSGTTYVLMFMESSDLAKNFKASAMQSNSAMIKDLMSSLTIEEIESELAKPTENE